MFPWVEDLYLLSLGTLEETVLLNGVVNELLKSLHVSYQHLLLKASNGLRPAPP